MEMDEGMDTGAIIDILRIQIPFEWTVKELIAAFGKVGPKFLQDTLRNYAKGELVATPQDHTQSTFCQKITKVDGEIDPAQEPLESVYAKYRAYALWPKIWFDIKGKKNLIESLVLDASIFDEYKEKPLRNTEKKLNPAIRSLTIKPE